MTTLKEIKRLAKNTLYVNPNPEKIGKDDYLAGKDVGLLVRAVGQLRAFAFKDGALLLTAKTRLDPDVLELLDDE